jgi:glutamyl-tRNA reductase
VELRERFGTLGLGADRCPQVVEHVVLSTCYRVELYAYLADGVEDARDALIDALADAHGIDRTTLVDHLYVHGGEDVARHLSRVAAGLDSLVLGEAEILAQVRAAFDAAGPATGPALSLVFRTAITAGRRTRTETSIGVNPGTASSMAISLVEGALGDLRGKRALVVGVGQIGSQTLKALADRGITSLAVANRSRERAAEVAAGYDAALRPRRSRRGAAWADFARRQRARRSPSQRELVGRFRTAGGRSCSSIPQSGRRCT